MKWVKKLLPKFQDTSYIGLYTWPFSSFYKSHSYLQPLPLQPLFKNSQLVWQFHKKLWNNLWMIQNKVMFSSTYVVKSLPFYTSRIIHNFFSMKMKIEFTLYIPIIFKMKKLAKSLELEIFQAGYVLT